MLGPYFPCKVHRFEFKQETSIKKASAIQEKPNVSLFILFELQSWPKTRNVFCNSNVRLLIQLEEQQCTTICLLDIGILNLNSIAEKGGGSKHGKRVRNQPSKPQEVCIWCDTEVIVIFDRYSRGWFLIPKDPSLHTCVCWSKK